LAGSQGPAGPGLDTEWPFISAVSWRHQARIGIQDALNLLARLEARPSQQIADATVNQAPQLIEVWFAADAASARAPVPLQVFHGQTRIQPGAIAWSLTDATDAIAAAMRPAGRITVRIHCGLIQASDGRMFSAALDAVTRVTTLKGSGGVHETWFFVAP
jgi:hypothetical protein